MREETQIVEAHFTNVDLAVNDLDNPEWDEANPVQINRYWSGEFAPVGRHAEARILWSNRALYVRYVCNQTEPLVISAHPQTITKTMYLWDRDVCEIFIAPDPNVPEKYFEFEVAPTGEWMDLGLDWTSGKRQSNWQFTSGMAAAARTEADRVAMGIRIPWSDRVPKPEKAALWRANLFRCVTRDPKLRYLCWQPTHTLQPYFHVPQAFGWLAFK